MKKILIIFRDIFFVFIFTALFIFLFSEDKDITSTFQNFDGYGQQLQKKEPKRKQGFNKKKSSEKYYIREFNWKDSNKQIRKTEINIKQSAIKKEINKFGLKRGMNNPILLKRRGFIIIHRRDEMVNGRLKENVKFIVDYKAIFNRNLPHFKDLTQQLMASIPGNKINHLYSFLKFVQHIPYRRSPRRYSGKFINKFFVPLVCLYEQSGDCDSKSLLLSEFLATYPNSKEKMGIVLIYGQGIAHAILALKKKPLMGMSSIFVKDSGYYILIETTLPRWSPGFISYRVRKAIKAGYIKYVPLN